MLAAVDLGSNSFRMVIARVDAGQLQMVDRLREGVRLGGYLDERQRLTPEGQERALQCLHRFGERLRDFPQGTVRVVGTNTLRRARKIGRFLDRAQDLLGHPIEVVSGREEARLIFLGVAHSLAGGPARRLVVDIGGGSTECILGHSFDPRRTQSLYMGCVSYTLGFFSDGKLSAKAMRNAETAARLELRAIESEYRGHGWDEAVGASGTVHAIANLLRLQGWSGSGITREGLEKLREFLLQHEHVDKLRLDGLRRDRARVLPGGLAILRGVFDSLGVERMFVAPGAMREGVLFDLLGRLRQEDTREQTIRRLIERYQVDVGQAERVERIALQALGQVGRKWRLDTEQDRTFLRWAAQLHEVGLAIAHGGYHKHGAYVLQHSDMAGFSMQNQKLLALLVRGHRRKLPVAFFKEMLPDGEVKRALRLCALLRFACLLNRSRSDRQLPEVRFRAKGKRLRVAFPEDWLERHPLTRADVLQEAEYLRAMKVRLEFGSFCETAESS